MKTYSKKPTRKAEISTSALPDIIFLLLFFFMVSATIKPNEQLLEYENPNAHNIVRPDKKFLIKELTVGLPKMGNIGQTPRISDGKRYLEIIDIPQWVSMSKATLPENYQDQMIVLLKADMTIDMGLVADIQEKLREADARKIIYRTNTTEE
ncbi:MAG: biopolymer transporter ExbD [Cyclobacteriaceae bacterium]